tara:strand:- start:1944 stop:2399 length:456 start_codon:yes stop_codon:yes gene_type:complete
MVENISKSEVKFNQAGYQQERINDLMRVVNFCWINPTKFNPSFQDYNYRVIFRVLTSYYTEIRVKLKDERESIDKVMHNLDKYIETNPIVSEKKNASLYKSKGNNVNFNTISWELIKNCLLIYQNKILDAADAKGMGNPTKKDITKAAIDL